MQNFNFEKSRICVPSAGLIVVFLILLLSRRFSQFSRANFYSWEYRSVRFLKRIKARHFPEKKCALWWVTRPKERGNACFL